MMKVSLTKPQQGFVKKQSFQGNTVQLTKNNPIKDTYSFKSKQMSNPANKKKIGFGIDPVVTPMLVLSAIIHAAFNITVEHSIKGISKAIDQKRKRDADLLNNKILTDVNRLQESTGLTKRQIEKIYRGKIDRVKINPSEDGNEKGLNKVIGNIDLKYGLAKRVLMPLCDVMDGRKDAHNHVPNGICFFGPTGMGKTYIAEALCEHYEEKGGYFEEIEYTYDDKKDIIHLEKTFSDAEKRFNRSGKKKYTMVMLDMVDLQCNKEGSPYNKKLTKELIKLTDNCKDRGVIFVTTACSLNNTEPSLLKNGRTDLRIPVGYMENYVLADMISYNLAKNNIAHKKINYAKVLKPFESNELCFMPDEVEYNLNREAQHVMYVRGGYIKTGDIKRVLAESFHEFDEKQLKQFEKDKSYAKILGGLYEY